MSSSPPAIVGVATATAAFAGPAERGPLDRPLAVVSITEFERAFGGERDLSLDGERMPNFLWHAARGFFEQGGRRLLIQRVSGAGERRPKTADYEGTNGHRRGGLRALESLREVGIVATPGSSYGLEGPYRSESQAIARALIAHAERCGDRFALVDCGDGQDASGALSLRSELGGDRAALYHPWLVVAGSGGHSLAVPPSGFVAGALAATDLSRGVWAAATQPLVGVAGLDVVLGQTERDLLGAAQVNPIRRFDDDHRIWGARTLGSDPEWKYVSISRQLIYLEQSIERGLGWAVFEPNDEPLWMAVRSAVEDFLDAEWRRGALAGSTPDAAFFVRCDRTTMTDVDVDAGRLIWLVGVAVMRPAEFVVLRFSATALRP